MALYTNEVKKIFRTIRPPYSGFIVDMVEYESFGYLALRVYRDNIESFSEPQKLRLAEYLYQVRDGIRSLGVRCYVEGAENEPPNRKSIPN